ncbi:MAG: endonuclease III [Bacteroidetes bacterium]|nr:endonuclease III [Bacteroidota bacterium]
MKDTWTKAFEPLLKLYENRKHPLDYQNRYQLLVMVILSARDTDKHINNLAPTFFEAYPTLQSLSKAAPADLHPYISKVSGFNKKINWLIEIATELGEDNNIPWTIHELTKLPGIGRKTANVIIRESGGVAEGVIVDLHVVRVAPRIGVAVGSNPEKIEKQLMDAIPDKQHWNNLGMGISFLGRDICRPKNPKCPECVTNAFCQYYGQIRIGKTPEAVKTPLKEPKRNF